MKLYTVCKLALDIGMLSECREKTKMVRSALNDTLCSKSIKLF